MTLILVLLMFAIFIGIDYLRSRHAVKPLVMEPAQAAAPRHLPAGEFVEGFLVPANVRYHAGHAWAQKERKRLMRVGVDEFGAALLGNIDHIELPKPGRWVRQGQKVWSFTRNGEKTEMVSPVEGEIVEVNPEVVKDPSLLRKDPFGQGWLMTVHVPDEESVQRNFLPVHLVKAWVRDCADRLFAKRPQLAGPVMADGGRQIEDFATGLPGTNWRELTQEFFIQ
jgi:glycine cleavage system H protein